MCSLCFSSFTSCHPSHGLMVSWSHSTLSSDPFPRIVAIFYIDLPRTIWFIHRPWLQLILVSAYLLNCLAPLRCSSRSLLYFLPEAWVVSCTPSRTVFDFTLVNEATDFASMLVERIRDFIYDTNSRASLVCNK